MVISEVQNHKERIEELYPAHKCGIVYIYMCNKIVLIRTFYFHIKAHSELNLYDRHVAKCQFCYLIL